MLSPKRTKFRKAHKGRIHGIAKGGTNLDFGGFGLKAMEPDRNRRYRNAGSLGRDIVRFLADELLGCVVYLPVSDRDLYLHSRHSFARAPGKSTRRVG